MMNLFSIEIHNSLGNEVSGKNADMEFSAI